LGQVLSSQQEALMHINKARVIYENLLRKIVPGMTSGRFFGSRNIFNAEQNLNFEMIKINFFDNE